jgi:hypothetical protein
LCRARTSLLCLGPFGSIFDFAGGLTNIDFARRDPYFEISFVFSYGAFANVNVAGIQALHQSNIAHAYLKPANVYLIRDPTIKAGYQLKLIDMDFSLLTDHRAPWHGHQG